MENIDRKTYEFFNQKGLDEVKNILSNLPEGDYTHMTDDAHMFASAHNLNPDYFLADLYGLNRVALLKDLTRHVELIEGLGGLLEAEKELHRKCILKWITPEILELTEAIKNFKYLEELKGVV